MSKTKSLLCVLVTATLGHGVSDAAETEEPGGYLFAHMLKSDYGRLYYAISTDGLRWESLNGRRRIFDDYRGHPDITRGHDGRWYLIGNVSHDTDIRLWVSSDLVKWEKLRDLRLDVTAVPGYREMPKNHGAPKLHFDTATATYLITWHSSILPRDKRKPEQFWSGQRTLYITSKDLETFTQPKRLFEFETATIDVIVRRDGEHCYAILKDERYPNDNCPTGKTIRIAEGDSLTGPWREPGPKISPNFREAPTVIRRPDGTDRGAGWYLYFEQYPGIAYNLLTAPRLAGPWHDLHHSKYTVPRNVRHGCMIALPKAEFDALRAAYGRK